jgi:hypothetical protein
MIYAHVLKPLSPKKPVLALSINTYLKSVRLSSISFKASKSNKLNGEPPNVSTKLKLPIRIDQAPFVNTAIHPIGHLYLIPPFEVALAH